MLPLLTWSVAQFIHSCRRATLLLHMPAAPDSIID